MIDTAGGRAMAGRAALAILGLLAAAPMPATAACKLSAYAVPTRMEGMRPLIRAKVNGRDVDFLLDSGSFFNAISAKFAAEQRLPAFRTPTTGSRIGDMASANVSGVAGSSVVSPVVQANSFVFGGVDFKKAAFYTFDDLEGGIIGQNMLKIFDVEYDLGKDVIRVLTAKGCAGQNLAYWANGPYAMLPLDKSATDHTAASVTVNGVKLRAYFDTGASGTFITRRAAARAGVKVTDPEVKPSDPVRGIDHKTVKAWTARFASVKIGDEEIKNGLLTIGDSSPDDFDVLIGADFFLSHHVVVANSQGLIYFTFNGGHVFNVARRPERGPSGDGQAPAPH